MDTVLLEECFIGTCFSFLSIHFTFGMGTTFLAKISNSSLNGQVAFTPSGPI